jgi:hypothetical protein
MRDRIVEIFKNFESEYKNCLDFNERGVGESEYDVVIEEIEKLYEPEIIQKTTIVKPKFESKPYDKSKFRIFETWEETKRVSEISEEEFLGFLKMDSMCRGINTKNGFRYCDIRCSIECVDCTLNPYKTKTKADILKWMDG